MDVFITKWGSPHWFTTAVSQQLPPGIEILGVYQTALTMPSLQSQVHYAEYRVEVATDKTPENIESAISSLLSLEHLPWHHHRDTGQRNYDLRALIKDLWLIDWQPPDCTIGLRLRCDSRGSGRPEQVISALGFANYPQSIHRTKLIMEA
jgi:radical SAM-linked protein